MHLGFFASADALSMVVLISIFHADVDVEA